MSLTSTSFWQLCLDSIVFPTLSSLASPHSIDLELTDDLTTARSHCINLLEKIFLLHLPLLLRWEGAEGGGTGFSACWLHVLKSMDGLMYLGMRRERVMMERHRRSVYDRKRERRRSDLPRQSDNPAAEGGTASGGEWDGLDGGVLLTESVEEALKNLLLVMKASRVFGVSPGGGGVLNGELWELTWAIVDPVFPHLKLALFPEMQQPQTPAPVHTPAQPAPNDAAKVDRTDAPAASTVTAAGKEREGEPSLSLQVVAGDVPAAGAEDSESGGSHAASNGAKEGAHNEMKQQFEAPASHTAVVNEVASNGAQIATAPAETTVAPIASNVSA